MVSAVPLRFKASPAAEHARTNPWVGRLDLLCDPAPLTFAEAQAHVLVMQQTGCVVRQSKYGRGSERKGKTHYNRTPEWPTSWRPNKHEQYYVVIENVTKQPVQYTGEIGQIDGVTYHESAAGDPAAMQRALDNKAVIHAQVIEAQMLNAAKYGTGMVKMWMDESAGKS